MTVTELPTSGLDLVLEVLTAHAAETERLGHVAPASVEAMRGAGLFTLGPDGPAGELPDVTSLCDTLVHLATGCPASSWVAGTSAVSKRFAQLAFGPDALGQLIDMTAPTCGTGQPSGELIPTREGPRLDGRWRWISGCEVSPVAVLAARAPGDEGMARHVAVIPLSRAEVIADWDVAGMRGTGSHALQVTDALIAPAHAASFKPDMFFPLFSAVTVAAPVLGAALGALELTEDRAGAAPAAELIDDALVIAHDVCAQIQSLGTAATMEDMLRLRGRLGHAARLAVRAFDPLFDLAGASAFRADDPRQRLWRDASVGARHAQLRPAAARPAG